MPDLNIVPLHDGRPSLADIPGRLRRLADEIESGQWADLAPVESVIVAIPRKGDFPRVLHFGDIHNHNDALVTLALAQHWLIANVVTRG